MRKTNTPKIFLDSGNPEETKIAQQLVSLQGQTTNPSLIVKNPLVNQYLQTGRKLTYKESLNIYKQIILEIRKYLKGAISVEVYSDFATEAKSMIKEAEIIASWSDNIIIKFPTTSQGILAASEFIKNGGQVNMTLVFTQLQALIVYQMIQKSNSRKTHYLSPFIGRWEDHGYQGMDLVKNINKMYQQFNKKYSLNNLKIIAASIRSLYHWQKVKDLKIDIITLPLKILKLEKNNININKKTTNNLKPIKYINYSLENVEKYHLKEIDHHPLLIEGIKKFVNDWKNFCY